MPRSLRRFYVDQVFSREGDSLQLSSRETFHLHQVLRLKAGNLVRVFNRTGQGAEALIESVSRAEGARLRLKEIFPLAEKGLFINPTSAVGAY